MNWLKQMYNWVLKWAETPYGPLALFLLAFVESIFFPIPPDVLLIALALGSSTKAFRFTLNCTIGSVSGAHNLVALQQAIEDFIIFRILLSETDGSF